MKTIRISTEIRKQLVGRSVINVGDDYLDFDNGVRIYIDEGEIDSLGAEPIRDANFWVIETGADCDGV